MTENSQHLPREIADRFTKPFAQFVRIEAAAGVLLLLATLAALALANSPLSKPFLTFWETSIGFHLGSLRRGHRSSLSPRAARNDAPSVGWICRHANLRPCQCRGDLRWRRH